MSEYTYNLSGFFSTFAYTINRPNVGDTSILLQN
jgi:hypothetical protein